ncbi:uncharacterized protein LOC110731700 [Chenopodium quinoa]|uniref:uncharacterized protein LOC110731700 n=1 Tax=Chenopodium quinoa TaxID=63459 RepID=UPI000B77DCDB|nr:uncharacterized protein LOC110731700 [Chenopodium quinoa]
MAFNPSCPSQFASSLIPFKASILRHHQSPIHLHNRLLQSSSSQFATRNFASKHLPHSSVSQFLFADSQFVPSTLRLPLRINSGEDVSCDAVMLACCPVSL